MLLAATTTHADCTRFMEANLVMMQRCMCALADDIILLMGSLNNSAFALKKINYIST